MALLLWPQSSFAVKRARSLGMAPQNFLDNLEHLRVVTSVALEYVQDNRDEFARSGTGIEVRRAEKSISQLRVLMMQLEKEFTILQYLLADDAAVAAPPPRTTTSLVAGDASGHGESSGLGCRLAAARAGGYAQRGVSQGARRESHHPDRLARRQETALTAPSRRKGRALERHKDAPPAGYSSRINGQSEIESVALACSVAGGGCGNHDSRSYR